MRKISLISILIIILLSSCTAPQKIKSSTTPRTTAITTPTPTSTKATISKAQAISIARDAMKDYLEYDKSLLASDSEVAKFNNNDFDSLIKGDLKYIDDLDAITPDATSCQFKDANTWKISFNDIRNTKCIALGVWVYVDVVTGEVISINKTV